MHKIIYVHASKYLVFDHFSENLGWTKPKGAQENF